MKAWTLALLLVTGSALAEPIPYRQSLIKHGINASAYGEAVVQRDDILKTDLVSGRVQGGWLLSRDRYLATTIGATYGGLLGNACPLPLPPPSIRGRDWVGVRPRRGLRACARARAGSACGCGWPWG